VFSGVDLATSLVNNHLNAGGALDVRSTMEGLCKCDEAREEGTLGGADSVDLGFSFHLLFYFCYNPSSSLLHSSTPSDLLQFPSETQSNQVSTLFYLRFASTVNVLRLTCLLQILSQTN
jgi:hypothetical protein